jgi:hypothetical protein
MLPDLLELTLRRSAMQMYTHDTEVQHLLHSVGNVVYK